MDADEDEHEIDKVWRCGVWRVACGKKSTGH